MSDFKSNYQDDLKRYNGNAEVYIRIWLYLYRKCCYNKTPVLNIIYKALFRLWSNLRGLEITANNQIGGGYLYRSRI